MGSRDQLGQAGDLPASRPGSGRGSTAALPLTEARAGFAAMISGDLFGKIVFTR